MKRFLITLSMLVMPALALAAPSPKNQYDFTIENPLGGTGVNDLGGVIQLISDNLLRVAIPIAVIMIVWAGINLLTSRGDSSKVKKGKDILTWTVIGLALIFLSSGMVDFIRSILSK